MEEQAKALYLQARENWRAGDLRQAEVNLRQAIQMDPYLPHPHFDLAALLERMSDNQKEALDHYQRFVELAIQDPELAPQVEQARQRLEETQTDYAARALSTNVLVSQVKAIKIARKELEGGLRKLEHFAESAPKVLIPLWRVRCRRRNADHYYYFSASNGRLLSVEKNAVRFINAAGSKARRVTGLDGVARFSHVPVDELTADPPEIRVNKQVIADKARETLKMEVVDTELILFPVWQFTAIHKKTGRTREIFVDTTFGRLVPAGNPRVGAPPAVARKPARTAQTVLLVVLALVMVLVVWQVVLWRSRQPARSPADTSWAPTTEVVLT